MTILTGFRAVQPNHRPTHWRSLPQWQTMQYSCFERYDVSRLL
jgi:hypothetical protein